MTIMNKATKIFLWVVFGALVLVAFVFVTQLLWNWLVPTLFNGPVITFWQTLGLLVLSKILFSGFGKKDHCGPDKSYWKKRLHTKFSHMTEEERAAFKQKMREKWCSLGEETRDGDKPSND